MKKAQTYLHVEGSSFSIDLSIESFNNKEVSELRTYTGRLLNPPYIN